MPSSKLSAFFSLLLVFVSGVIVGGAGYHVYQRSSTPPAPVAKSGPGGGGGGGQNRPDPAVIRKARIEELTKEVGLDSTQVDSLGHIYDDTEHRFFQVQQRRMTEMHSIWEDQIDTIKKMLRPDQLPRYEKFLSAQQAAEAERKKRRKGSGPEHSPDKK